MVRSISSMPRLSASQVARSLLNPNAVSPSHLGGPLRLCAEVCFLDKENTVHYCLKASLGYQFSSSIATRWISMQTIKSVANPQDETYQTNYAANASAVERLKTELAR